jgi:glycosyltransferase involved in cell wall biosynthesis
MGNPLVSVILANYNHGPSLPLTIAAVRAQTYEPIELVFVDDRSTDDSVSIARELGVDVLSTPRNGGPSASRNLGAAAARGEILLFVDSDVAIDPETVARSVAVLRAEPGVGAICGMLSETPLVRDSLVQECRCLQAHYWRISAVGCGGQGRVSFLFTAICAMRAEVFREIGPFHPGLRETEEVEYGQRLSQRYEIRLTSAFGGRHRDEPRLWPLLRKVFHRCRLRVPLYAVRRRYAQGFETASRIWGSACAALAAVALPLPFLLHPLWSLVPALALLAWLASDADMYRFVKARRGWPFLLCFAGVQFLLNLAITAGAAVGVLQWLVSRPFRTLYVRESPA